jgi:UDP-3-O-[3-hydroxymyristoyl] glucosamine N-acyltransferase
MINIYVSGNWSDKITSLLPSDEYKVYDKDTYDKALATNQWVIAVKSGEERLVVQTTLLRFSEFSTLFKGCNNLTGVTFGKGLTVGCCSLIRPGTVIGDQVYIGAGSIIDLNCNIGDGVTIGDNVTVNEGVTIPNNTTIPSGSVVSIEE